MYFIYCTDKRLALFFLQINETFKKIVYFDNVHSVQWRMDDEKQQYIL